MSLFEGCQTYGRANAKETTQTLCHGSKILGSKCIYISGGNLQFRSIMIQQFILLEYYS